MSFRKFVCVIIIVGAALAGCASGGPAATAEGGMDGVYEGLFSEGFEVSMFEPCDANERWWLTGFDTSLRSFLERKEELRRDYIEANEIVSAGYVAPLFYLRLKGGVSDVGEFGHMGAYQRQIVLREVVELRIATVEDSRRCSS